MSIVSFRGAPWGDRKLISTALALLTTFLDLFLGSVLENLGTASDLTSWEENFIYGGGFEF